MPLSKSVLKKAPSQKARGKGCDVLTGHGDHTHPRRQLGKQEDQAPVRNHRPKNYKAGPDIGAHLGLSLFLRGGGGTMRRLVFHNFTLHRRPHETLFRSGLFTRRAHHSGACISESHKYPPRSLDCDKLHQCAGNDLRFPSADSEEGRGNPTAGIDGAAFIHPVDGTGRTPFTAWISRSNEVSSNSIRSSWVASISRFLLKGWAAAIKRKCSSHNLLTLERATQKWMSHYFSPALARPETSPALCSMSAIAKKRRPSKSISRKNSFKPKPKFLRYSRPSSKKMGLSKLFPIAIASWRAIRTNEPDTSLQNWALWGRSSLINCARRLNCVSARMSPLISSANRASTLATRSPSCASVPPSPLALHVKTPSGFMRPTPEGLIGRIQVSSDEDASISRLLFRLATDRHSHAVSTGRKIRLTSKLELAQVQTSTRGHSAFGIRAVPQMGYSSVIRADQVATSATQVARPVCVFLYEKFGDLHWSRLLFRLRGGKVRNLALTSVHAQKEIQQGLNCCNSWVFAVFVGDLSRQRLSYPGNSGDCLPFLGASVSQFAS